MICPLLSMGYGSSDTAQIQNCLEKKCAWWVINYDQDILSRQLSENGGNCALYVSAIKK
jgi:hypothetical protein